MDDLQSTRRGPSPTRHVDILRAAARLFAQRGVSQTTTGDIAAEAGTTERTLLKHFESRDALVHAVIADAVLPHLAPGSLEGLRRVMEAHQGDFRAWHAGLLAAREEALERVPELTLRLLAELLRDDAQRARLEEQWHKAAWAPLLALFTGLQKEGRISNDLHATILVRLFLSVSLGFLIGRLVSAPDQSLDDTTEITAITAFFARGTRAA